MVKLITELGTSSIAEERNFGETTTKVRYWKYKRSTYIYKQYICEEKYQPRVTLERKAEQHGKQPSVAVHTMKYTRQNIKKKFNTY